MNQPSRRLLLVPALWAAVALSAAEPAKPVAPRFSPANMDTSVSPGQDFAAYAFGNWRKANPVPADKSRWEVGFAKAKRGPKPRKP